MASLVKQFVVTIYLEGDTAKRLRLNDDVSLVAEEVLRERFPEAGVEVVEAQNQYDQYGGVVPPDLVALPSIDKIITEESQTEAVLSENVEWWEILHPDMLKILVASAAQLDQANVERDDEPLSEWLPGGADYEDLRFAKVDHALKRWSVEDSFYHA